GSVGSIVPPCGGSVSVALGDADGDAADLFFFFFFFLFVCEDCVVFVALGAFCVPVSEDKVGLDGVYGGEMETPESANDAARALALNLCSFRFCVLVEPMTD